MTPLRPAKLNGDGIYVHDFASHLPFIAQAIKGYNGPVLEVGCGFYSTPLLYSHSDPFVWLVEDSDWANAVSSAMSDVPPPHKVDFDNIEELSALIASLRMPTDTFVFMDFERPPTKRRPVLDVLLKHFQSIHIHDANWVPLDGLNTQVYKGMFPHSGKVER